LPGILEGGGNQKFLNLGRTRNPIRVFHLGIRVRNGGNDVVVFGLRHGRKDKMIEIETGKGKERQRKETDETMLKGKSPEGANTQLSKERKQRYNYLQSYKDWRRKTEGEKGEKGGKSLKVDYVR